jgi:hypothetical protein
MKYQYHFIKLFCFGFLLAAGVNYIASCSKDESPTQPIDDNPAQYSETSEMKNLSDSLISAFKSENKEKVMNCFNEEFKDTYAPILNNTTKSLTAFGTALEKRILKFANSFYAEYELTIDGITYTIAYANSGDSKWQLVRL